MSRTAVACAVALVASTLVSSHATAAPKREGLWEVTIQLKVEGMPFTPPAMTHTQCIKPGSYVPSNPNDKHNCKVIDQNVEGNTVSWKVKCDNSEGSGKITYGEGTFDGTVDLKMTGKNGKTMQASQSMKGVRKGDCPS